MNESYEDMLKKVQETVDKLERGDLPLEDSITCYADGLKSLKMCYDRLNKAEKKLEEISRRLDDISVKKTDLD